MLFTAFLCPLRNITVWIYWPSSTELAPRPGVEGGYGEGRTEEGVAEGVR